MNYRFIGTHKHIQNILYIYIYIQTSQWPIDQKSSKTHITMLNFKSENSYGELLNILDKHKTPFRGLE